MWRRLALNLIVHSIVSLNSSTSVIMAINISNVLNLVKKSLDVSQASSKPTNRENELANILIDTIKLHDESTSVDEDIVEETLDIEEDDLEDDLEDKSDDDSEDEEPDEYLPEEKVPIKSIVNLEYKRKVIAFFRGAKRKKCRSFRQVKNKYSRVTSRSRLYEWETQLKQDGAISDKINYINSKVYEEVVKARKEDNRRVHDDDIRIWGLLHAAEINFPNFKASSSWVWKFKQRYSICRRRIVKQISRAQKRKADQTTTEASALVNEFKHITQSYGLKQILNSDQTPFNFEMNSEYTLEFRGSKRVAATKQSAAGDTHSYTLMPLLNADGEFVGPLFIILKGPLPKVKQIFSAANIHVVESDSGKITKPLMKSWFTDIYLKYAPTSSVLLLDSLRIHHDVKMHQQLRLVENGVRIMKIPEGRTGELQPLDLDCNRPWKAFVEKFYHHVSAQNIEVNLYSRDQVLKLQSLVYNQFCSPRFRFMFRNGWIRANLVQGSLWPATTPAQFSYKLDDLQFCDRCRVPSFLQCGWCKNRLCFTHYFIDYHYCQNYVD